MYCYRDRRQFEVDLVLERSDGKIVGVEVKASASASSRDFKGLAALSQYSGDRFAHGVLFYTGDRILPFSRDGLKLYAVPIGVLFNEYT